MVEVVSLGCVFSEFFVIDAHAHALAQLNFVEFDGLRVTKVRGWENVESERRDLNSCGWLAVLGLLRIRRRNTICADVKAAEGTVEEERVDLKIKSVAAYTDYTRLWLRAVGFGKTFGDVKHVGFVAG